MGADALLFQHRAMENACFGYLSMSIQPIANQSPIHAPIAASRPSYQCKKPQWYSAHSKELLTVPASLAHDTCEGYALV